ncbi:PIN-like domain-containing protein [Streptomyces sp. NPDC057062]|uniref:PIN-like domain-containing protein n=1 Tax=Streptomyces sp. NPDC057062 TaxID=3346011 RepID=UPI00362DF0B1
MWAQLLKEARERGRDVLFVTRDLKEDWWRATPSGMVRQPRLELVEELRNLTSRRFFMIEPSNLMRQASRIFELGGRVDQRSVSALEQLETDQQPNVDGRWTESSLQALIDRLLETAPVQAQTILDAALNDGFVSRETVYKLGGYDESRMLRGFTRPVKTATRYLQDAGVPTGSPDENPLGCLRRRRDDGLRFPHC